MKWLFRYLQWFILGWGLSILIIFKIVNNFVFENNESLLFIFLLFGVPIALIVFKKMITKNKKKHYVKEQSSFYQQIMATLKKDFLDKLKGCKKNYDEESAVITFNERGRIEYFNTYALLSIDNTQVKFYFHYGKNLLEMRKYDVYGLEKRPVRYFHERVLEKVNFLLSYNHFTYYEYKKGKTLIGCELRRDDEVIYLIKEKDKTKLKPKNADIKEVII